MNETNETKSVTKPKGLVDLVLKLHGATEDEPLKAFSMEVVAACDESAADMRRRIFAAVDYLREQL